MATVRGSRVGRGVACRAWRVALPVALCLALSGCGSSDDVVDGGEPRGEPDEDDDSAAGLRFVVAEDGVLEGALSDATRPGAPPVESFGLLSAPARGALELLADGRAFRYTPQRDFSGTDGFEYGADDGRVLRVTIDVTPVPDAPVLLADELSLVAERGSRFVRRLQAFDADGDALVFEASGLPAWLALDPDGGELSGTPGAADVGRSDGITLAVVDPSDRRDEQRGVSVEVVDPGEAPVLDPTRFPASLDGRERRVVEVFPESVDLDGMALAVESDPALVARVDGRRVTLEAGDVESVTELTLVLALTDRLGVTTRAVVPMTLYPLNESGGGRTLLGARSGPGVHLVVLGDGYREDRQPLLRADAERLIELLRSDPGTRRHIGAFNIHVVESVSRDAGARPAGVPARLHSTLYGSYYDCEGVPRLICADTLALFERAGTEYPEVLHVVLFVDDARLGGSGGGGGAAIASRGQPGIALHELGHSLAGLADEYVDGALVNALSPAFVEGLFPNVTAITDPDEVPWARWIEPDRPVPSVAGEPGVGLFEGALYRQNGVFRPTDNSRMREFEQPFGPVNSEQWVLSVYRGSTVRDFEPRVFDIEIPAGESQRFSVTPFFPADVQAIEWSLNGERVRRADDARVFELSPPVGTHRLRLAVRDVSGLIRREPPHSGVFEWNWAIEVK